MASAIHHTRRGDDDVRPVPDPTELTTAALVREIASLKEVVFTRLDGMDKAIELFNENLTRAPTEVDKQISHLRQLLFERFAVTTEKFASVATQFSERDVRTEQTQRDSKVAVDAALQAAKEAVGKQQEASDRAIQKSELSTTKQIDQMQELIKTVSSGFNDKLDDVKQRLTRIEGQELGQKSAKTTQETSNMSNVAIVSVVFSVLFGLIGVGFAIFSHIK